MAQTQFETSNALVPKLVEEKLYRDSRKEAYWDRFMSKGTDSPVSVKTDLQSKKGDKLIFGLRMRLQGQGVEDDAILEGNEEALTTYDNSLTLKMYRHAVRDKGALHRQRTAFDIDEESKAALKDWGAEKIDQLMFDAAGISGTAGITDPTKIFYLNASGVPTSASSYTTAKAAMSATNSVLTLNFILLLKQWAKTGGNRNYVPIRPVKVDGKDHYVLLVHPDALYDLKASAAYQTAQREAQARGKDHPLFKGSDAIWEGVVIHEHENVGIATDGGGASVAWSKGLFFGAQALLWAEGGENGARKSIVAETFDYKNQNAYAWGVIARAGKSTFNSKDYGSVGICCARTNISGL